MKRLLATILFMLLLTGCGGKPDSKNLKDSNMFVYIQKEDSFNAYDVVYHRDTKVMYVVSQGSASTGVFTLLVNPDGTPMLYKAESEDEE